MNRDNRTRQLVLVVVAVAIAIAAWVIVWNRGNRAMLETDHEAGHETGGQPTGELDAMPGMAGMDMSSDGSAHLTADEMRQFGITFGTAEVRTLEERVRTTGVVTFDETRVTEVALKLGGFVERLHVDFTGQPVRRGQPLLEIYSPELVAAQDELLVARQLERTMDESTVPGVPAGTSSLLAAAMRRLRLWDISEPQIQQILSSGEVKRTLTIYAPASGVVIEKRVVEGQAVQPGQSLYTIADLSEVWVEAELREHEAGRVREGTPATLEFAAFPGRPTSGRVEYVYPTLQAASRTIKARVAVANPGGRIKPGMYATVRFTSPGRAVLTVPATAVIRTGERSVIFVDMGDGHLMPHEVETGSVGEGYVEILSGVDAGARVVTSAQFILDSESNLAEVMKAMIGMETH